MKSNLRKLSIITMVAFFLLTGWLNANENPLNNEEKIFTPKTVKLNNALEISKVDPIQSTINKMTLNEKIGQMIIAGFDGSTGSNAQVLIKKYKLGGLILFGTNIKSPTQLVNLTNSIKASNKNNKVPLFISVDQEGGRVNRMPNGITDTPTARSIGNAKSERYPYNIGYVIARELSSFGFNTDFAPVLDIQSNPKNTVIGDRSFGTTSSVVSKDSEKMMEGIRKGNIISVVKHFPGHGDTSVDSHLELPVVNKNLSSLKNFELIPFNNAIKNHTDMIMVAHILMKKLDTKYPASMSKIVITDLLRKKYGYDGLVITDDMTMQAISKHYNLGVAAVRSINAGSNIILVGHGNENVNTIYESLYMAAKNNQISIETINKSVYKILSLKQKYKLSNHNVPPVNVSKLNSLIKQTVSNK